MVNNHITKYSLHIIIYSIYTKQIQTLMEETTDQWRDAEHSAHLLAELSL